MQIYRRQSRNKKKLRLQARVDIYCKVVYNNDMLTDGEQEAREARRKLIRWLIKMHPKMSDRDIAEMVVKDYGYKTCSHTFVNTIRHELK